MKRFIIIMLVLAFSVSPAFALSANQEANIALTDKLVQSEAQNRDLNEKLSHSKKGNKFFWTVVGMFILYDMSRSSDQPEQPPEKPPCRK